MPPEAASTDERIREHSLWRVLVARPEIGAIAGTIVVWIFFIVVAGDRGFLSLRGTATVLEVSAELGILAIAVALLMIAGEFDLSVGSVIGASGMLLTLLAVEGGWPLGLAIPAVFAFGLGVGYFNGILVIRTRLPSFIVTLATLFIFRGLTIGLTRLLTNRTQVGGLRDAAGYDAVHTLFAADISIGGAGFSMSILWWIGLALLATWVLRRTPFGNWIFGAGGDAVAARNVGVPVARVKISLFMATACAACLVGVIQALSLGGADVLRGEQREFLAIIAAVIGGNLLSGGYGSVVGAAFGALIFGMVRQGIVFTGVDADWFQVFLGGMLLVAMLVNTQVRKRALTSR